MGEIELMSTMILRLLPSAITLPSAKPVAIPSSPNSTDSTSGVSGTMVNTMSAWRTTSAGVARRVAVDSATPACTLRGA